MHSYKNNEADVPKQEISLEHPKAQLNISSDVSIRNLDCFLFVTELHINSFYVCAAKWNFLNSFLFSETLKVQIFHVKRRTEADGPKCVTCWFNTLRSVITCESLLVLLAAIRLVEMNVPETLDLQQITITAPANQSQDGSAFFSKNTGDGGRDKNHTHAYTHTCNLHSTLSLKTPVLVLLEEMFCSDRRVFVRTIRLSVIDQLIPQHAFCVQPELSLPVCDTLSRSTHEPKPSQQDLNMSTQRL